MGAGFLSPGGRVTLLISLALLLIFSGCKKASPSAAAPPNPVASKPATAARSLTGIARSFAADHPDGDLTVLGGTLHIVAEDVVVAGSKLRVTRHLAPDPSSGGALGNGWRLNWETQLTRAEDGRDAILLDAGGVAVFLKDGAQLTAKGVGTLALSPERAVLSRVDGGTDTFDPA